MEPKTSLQPRTVDIIKTKIYEIRGQRVMLDSDLAELYQVETKYLKRAVKSNIDRFPEDFMFELNESEMEILRCKNCTSNKHGGNRYNSFVFTEEGVAMLSGLLRSNVAVQVNINIMRAFVAMRHSIDMLKEVHFKIDNLQTQIKELSDSVDDILSTQNDINEDTSMQLELLNQSLAELQADKNIRKEFVERKPIGFKIENGNI